MDRERVHLRIPHDLADRLRQLADEQGVSRNTLLVAMIAGQLGWTLAPEPAKQPGGEDQVEQLIAETTTTTIEALSNRPGHPSSAPTVTVRVTEPGRASIAVAGGGPPVEIDSDGAQAMIAALSSAVVV